MAEDQQYLTEEGAAALRAELDALKNVKRPELAFKLKEAISMGDLSENADYADAKEQQAFLEGRINQLEALLRSAIIIESDKKNKEKIVLVGSQVVVQEEGESGSETFTIVGAAEADPNSGKISNESPIGAALLGRKVKDTVKVKTPGGEIVFKIKSIS
jgi:transcription elongation factor GreA